MRRTSCHYILVADFGNLRWLEILSVIALGTKTEEYMTVTETWDYNPVLERILGGLISYTSGADCAVIFRFADLECLLKFLDYRPIAC